MNQKQLVTVFYFDDKDLAIKHHQGYCDMGTNGRVILPRGFKANKQILAVCEGKVNVLNKLGDRTNQMHTLSQNNVAALTI